MTQQIQTIGCHSHPHFKDITKYKTYYVRLETNQIKSNVEATLSYVEMGRFIFIPTKHGTKHTLNTEIRTCLNIKKKYLMSKDE